MLWRICRFLLFVVAGGALAWWLALPERRWWPGLAGALLACLVWFALDIWRAGKVVLWLRNTQERQPPDVDGIWGEITERVRRQFRVREQQTAAAEQRRQDVLAGIQASPNGVVLLDAEQRIEWCNEMAADHLGFHATNDVAQHIGNLVREPAFARYCASGQFDRPLIIAGRSNSAAHPVRLSLQLHPYGEGRSLLLTHDVTTLEQAEAMRRDFVANVSHEIRTPLTVLSGFVETMLHVPLAENDRLRYLELMLKQSQRMQTLVNDLLTLSRLEGSPPPGAGQWLPVGTLLEQFKAEAEALSSALTPVPRPLVLTVGRDDDISGSEPELHSALSNLVTNAVRYTPPGNPIEVSWGRLPDGRGVFSVKDKGPGIAPEHLPRLTERFYRVDRSRSRETGGTGLGLAIVKHVVQRHGGELRISSKLGEGSVFAVVWPAARVRPRQEQAG
ncbi:MAG: Phosphate regulon sensor protein PhoR [Paracidovorax wautersii]|uniref:Phosphate regulon sensor protein PhoR n=1 Tax=Paracidovorax wautersii TaxID=1177982 RepID=A0A7V8FML1_9BURK|nr:MAG: Phosphate regulon sensor protein PhoR [Paracidovorax wautersii]